MTEERKKILILNYEFPPLGGGGGVAAKHLARGFIAAGYEVDYVTSGYGDLPKFENIEGINVYRVKIFGRKNLATASLISLISFPFCGFWQANKLLRQGKYAFISTHFAIPTGPLGIILSKKFKLPNVLSILGGDVYDPTKNNSPHKKWYLRLIVKLVLLYSDQVVAESQDIRDNAYKYYKIDKKISVLPLAYAPAVFQQKSRSELGLRQDAFYMISVGRLVKRKGFDFLLKSIASLKGDGILMLIGDGPEKDYLISLAAEIGIKDKVIFLGSVSEEQKFQYLNIADLYILSSIHEGFGIVLQEAMQVGLPIVATDHGGQVDLVKEGENGLLVSYGDTEQMSDSIKKIQLDPLLRQHMSSVNKEKIKEYSLDNIINQYLNFLK